MALYHKYRPQKFSEVVGQEHIKKTLTNALRQGKVSHAYIFSGPRGIGKTTVARILAKALNCQNKESDQGEPCDKCVSCQEIKSDRSLDVIEIDAASNRGIDEIRELRAKIKFTPSRDRYKVYIIDEVHMLTREAFNALLKTLEEPPKHAIFIMATTEPHRLPETILSRAQEFSFKRAGEKEITDYLQRVIAKEGFQIDEGSLNLIMRNSSGSYRDAIMFLDQLASLNGGGISLDQTQALLGLPSQEVVEKFTSYLQHSDSGQAVSLLNHLYQEGYDLRQFTRALVENLREKMMSGFDHSYLDLIGKFIKAGREIKDSEIAQLPLEMAIIEICGTPSASYQLEPARRSEKEEKNPSTTLGAGKEIKKQKPPAAVSLQKIKTRWPQVLSRLKEENHSLAMILADSEPLAADEGKIQLALANRFYAERLKEPKKYEKVTNLLAEILGKKFALDCVVRSPKEEDLLHDTLDVFGK